ncbi:DUF1800 domain-containing protein [Massilia sp. TS11]|uniref:DUF1800 domain-containing protein n=1 Tax=Massilia sp. TS11 TaxID=2908003 RepID=UPI001EDB8DB1|nr:DUF1800 domain-containing protein [Massilia sp. TS11]MCG2583677.1 DUF1800 domain-containing protein [Massilia sp. TS11]
MRVRLTFVILLLCSPWSQAAPAPEQQAAHVLNRMAFGPRPGDIERVVQMGVPAWINAQLNPDSLPESPELTARLASLDAANRSMGEATAVYVELVRQVKDETEEARQQKRAEGARYALQVAESRLARAIDSPRQLEEVLVDFWYNHFNVFSGKGLDRALVAAYERDAIRPYVMGNFRDMLGATAKHPAMLFYLDNFLSVAPEANLPVRAGAPKARARGLNENFARELMELHTLGVDGGYTQQDVTELARMLTGWTFDQRMLVRAGVGFQFDPRRHDNGRKQWLGRTVEPAGVSEGEMALDVLAMHPATARHLAYQLAQYFVNDVPPPALVERMAKAYLDNKAELKPMLRVMFTSKEFMDPANMGAKFKTPYQYVVSSVRATGLPVRNVGPLVATLNQLGMPLYGCQTPDGYKNTQDAWLNPDALSRRIAFATALGSGRLGIDTAPSAPPRQLVALAGKAAERAAANMDKTVNQAAAALADAASKEAPPMMAMAAPTPAPAAAPATPPAALDSARLQAALAPVLTDNTRQVLANQPEALRAALVLGSPEFMQH